RPRIWGNDLFEFRATLYARFLGRDRATRCAQVHARAEAIAGQNRSGARHRRRAQRAGHRSERAGADRADPVMSRLNLLRLAVVAALLAILAACTSIPEPTAVSLP